MALFFLLDLTLCSYLIFAQLQELKARLERLLLQRSFHSLSQLKSTFTSLHGETIEAYLLLEHLNNQFVSPAMLISLFGNFSLNIYLITLLTYQKVEMGEAIAFLFLILFQAFFHISSAKLLTFLAKAFTFSHPLLFRLQLNTHFHVGKGGPLFTNLQLAKLKLKMNNFYECLNSEKPFRFTAGPLGTIRTANVFQVSPFF